MKTHRRSLLLGLAAVALAGCAASPELSRIHDPDVDFHAYRSFAFLPGQLDESTSLMDRRMLAAARSQLERRGYAFDELNPELLLGIAAVVEERKDLRVVPGHLPGRDGIETDDYRLGRMAIDLFDVSRRQLIWRGTAEGRVSPAMLRDAGSAAEQAVAAVFEGFPVQPGRRAMAATPKGL